MAELCRELGISRKTGYKSSIEMPRAIMTGTVINEVLPVTTLIKLVKKNTAIKTDSMARTHEHASKAEQAAN